MKWFDMEMIEFMNLKEQGIISEIYMTGIFPFEYTKGFIS